MAREVATDVVQGLQQQKGIKTQYIYLGEHQGTPHLYLYQFSYESKKITIGIDLDYGDVYFSRKLFKKFSSEFYVGNNSKGYRGLKM